VVLVEHRLERCLAAADRVIVLDDGRVSCDSDPRGFLQWAGAHAPALQTPAARMFELAGLAPPPTGVKQARAALRARGALPPEREPVAEAPKRRRPLWARRRVDGAPPALALRGVWCELRDGPAILRGVDLRLAGGETVALMGRNGAGKSTLLRHAAGLVEPTRGRVEASGRVALLTQNPGDYFLHETVGEEASPAALAREDLADLSDRHPRDLSGGERQRLALAIVLDGDVPAATIALDEPTRGMDRDAKGRLSTWLRARAEQGCAVVVATHDIEFAASFATRVVLLADGRVIADGDAHDVLSGGWYFATETARVLGGAGGALVPEEGAALLAGPVTTAVQEVSR